MEVHGFTYPQPVHATLLMNNSDLPASRKCAGLAGHTSERCFCPVCTQTTSSLVTRECFDLESK